MSDTVVTKRPQTRELIIERTFTARCETVWMCWTDPNHLARWWGPKGWTTTIHELEVRPQGKWRYSMAPDDNSSEPARSLAVFNTVDEPRSLDYVDSFADPEWHKVPGSETDTTVTFDPSGEDTSVTITFRFPTVEALEQRVEMGVEPGMDDAFDRLDQHLAQLDKT